MRMHDYSLHRGPQGIGSKALERTEGPSTTASCGLGTLTTPIRGFMTRSTEGYVAGRPEVATAGTVHAPACMHEESWCLSGIH